MDKETLSNYGWIVICVLVLAVMIALATPFGSFVSQAVQSTAQGLFSVNQNALLSSGITINNQDFYDENAPELNPNDGTTVVENKEYYDEDYVYKYQESYGGWGVSVKNRNKTSYGPILESINDIPVTTMHYTFSECDQMTKAPRIPNNVTTLTYTFYGCDNLTEPPQLHQNINKMIGTFMNCKMIDINSNYIIPQKVTSLESLFFGCSNLKSISKIILHDKVTSIAHMFEGCNGLESVNDFKIPNGVQNMQSAFQSCNNLKYADKLTIPNSVTNMYQTFLLCKNLETAPIITANEANLYATFAYCKNLQGNIHIYTLATNTKELFFETEKPIVVYNYNVLTQYGEYNNVTIVNSAK